MGIGAAPSFLAVALADEDSLPTSPDSPPDFFHTLRTLIESFPASAPPFCLIGALALSAWGQPRATKDIDLLILLNEESQDRVLSALASRGFLKDEAWSEQNPILRGAMVRLYSGDVPIDLCAPRDAQEEEALTRRRMIEVEGLSLWTVSPEDLVLMKLKAGRPYDFGDVATILIRQGDALDLEYVRRWAKRLDVIDELAYVLDQSR